MEPTKIDDIYTELNEAFFDIPFGNSDYQNEKFVINGQLTPERAYRAIGLELTKRIRALRETYFEFKKENIDIEELKCKLENCKDKFEKQRIELDIEQKLGNRDYSKKLINDAVHEVKLLYQAFKKFPRYTRVEFEKGEEAHFKLKLLQQIGNVTGAAKSLADMGLDLGKTGAALKDLTGYDVFDQLKKIEG